MAFISLVIISFRFFSDLAADRKLFLCPIFPGILFEGTINK